MKTIKFKLNPNSIDNLISKLQNLTTQIEQIKEEVIETKVVEACDFIKGATIVDTGEIANSTHYEKSGNHFTIIQSGDHVFETEFGDGVYFGIPAYPNQAVIPVGIPTHDGTYFYTPTNPNSKYYDDELPPEKQRKKKAYGQTAGCQMYYGSVILKSEISRAMKEKVSDALSKI